MSEIKALKDMRNTVKAISGGFDEGWILEFLDEIEAEIAERFVEVPVDADGMSIRVGDVLSQGREKVAVTHVELHPWGWRVHGKFEDEDGTNGEISLAVNGHLACRHAKPRTLEDVLSEMLDRNSDGIGLREFNGDFAAFVEHYADEIRELMGAES